MSCLPGVCRAGDGRAGAVGWLSVCGGRSIKEGAALKFKTHLERANSCDS
jgi:hypothetical protein